MYLPNSVHTSPVGRPSSGGWFMILSPKICASHTSLCGFFTMLSVLLYLLYNLILETLSDIASGCCHHCLSTCFFLLLFSYWSILGCCWMTFVLGDCSERETVLESRLPGISNTRKVRRCWLAQSQHNFLFVCLISIFGTLFPCAPRMLLGRPSAKGFFPPGEKSSMFKTNQPIRPGWREATKKGRKLRMNHCCLDDQANVMNEWIFV